MNVYTEKFSLCLVLERTDLELGANVVVRGTIGALQVEHELFALGKNSHKTAAGRVVLSVFLEMSSELQHTSRKASNLILSRAAIGFALLEAGNFAQVSALSTVTSAV